MKSHPSLSYHEMKLDELDTFAEEVKQGIFGNVVLFPTPPVAEASFDTLIDAYVVTRAAYKSGGDAQKPAFITAKNALMKALDDTAEYVDDTAEGNENTVQASGIKPTKTVDSAGQVPAQPVVTLVRGAGIGTVIAEAAKVNGAAYYGCLVYKGVPTTAPTIYNNGQLVLGDTTNLVGIEITKGRRKTMMNLTAGSTYAFYFYAGNATGVSVLSEVRTIMAA